MNIGNSVIDDNILNSTIDELSDIISNDIGSCSNEYFGTKKYNVLGVQQNPKEYSNFLKWLSNQNINSYLEIGVGNGMSFFLNTYFIRRNIKCDAVDNTSYYNDAQKQNISNIVKYINDNCNKISTFYDMSSSQFFNNNTNKYDCIFIDGDHSYNGIKNDFENAKKYINDKGFIILHDIVSSSCPGVVKLWNEIKTEKCIEFIYSTTCGIGIYLL